MIAVIADDLTGAAELAAIGLSFGLKPRIMRDPPSGMLDANLLVLDTDSRSLPPEEAVTQVHQFAAALKYFDPVSVYKKTDSVLRGHVRMEIEALLDEMNLSTARLIPANPSLGRIIRDGRVYVNGIPLDETSFAEDPEFPATTSSVNDLLGFSDRIEIPDVETCETLDELASVPVGVLPAGGADYFRSWLAKKGFSPVTPAAASCGEIQLVVCGSASWISRNWAASRAGDGIPVVGMPDEVYKGSGDVCGWADAVRERMAEAECVIVAIRQSSASDPQTARRLCRSMAALVQKMVPSMEGGLAIEGGATASALFRGLGWAGFEVLAEMAPGVVLLRENGGHIVMIKPGSYAWPDVFLRARRSGKEQQYAVD